MGIVHTYPIVVGVELGTSVADIVEMGTDQYARILQWVFSNDGASDRTIDIYIGPGSGASLLLLHLVVPASSHVQLPILTVLRPGDVLRGKRSSGSGTHVLVWAFGSLLTGDAPL